MLVSVCVPTFNGERFLQEALNSIEAQNYRHIEVIISDDNSQDKTLEICEAFKERVSFPVYIYSHKPNGIGANWNNTVQKANGEFIKFLFQDDVLKGDCIEKMMLKAREDTKAGLIYCKRDFIWEDKTPHEWLENYKDLHCHWKHLVVNDKIIQGKHYLKDSNLLGFPDNKIGEPTAVLLRRSVFKKTGFFRTDMVQLLDIEFWYRVMKFTKIGFVDERLIYFRLHENQATRRNSAMGFKDYHKLYHILYHEFFSYLHPKLQWKLIWEVTRLRKIKQFLKLN